MKIKLVLLLLIISLSGFTQEISCRNEKSNFVIELTIFHDNIYKDVVVNYNSKDSSGSVLLNDSTQKSFDFTRNEILKPLLAINQNLLFRLFDSVMNKSQKGVEIKFFDQGCYKIKNKISLYKYYLEFQIGNLIYSGDLRYLNGVIVSAAISCGIKDDNNTITNLTSELISYKKIIVVKNKCIKTSNQ